jgi:hypothetical protein
MKQSCGNCVFFREDSKCKRNPPFIRVARERIDFDAEIYSDCVYREWPPVEHDDWCGEWEGM